MVSLRQMFLVLIVGALSCAAFRLPLDRADVSKRATLFDTSTRNYNSNIAPVHVSNRFGRAPRMRHKKAVFLARQWDRLPAKEKALFEKLIKLSPEQRKKIMNEAREKAFEEELKGWPATLKQGYDRDLRFLTQKKLSTGWDDRHFKRAICRLRRRYRYMNARLKSAPHGFGGYGRRRRHLRRRAIRRFGRNRMRGRHHGRPGF